VVLILLLIEELEALVPERNGEMFPDGFTCVRGWDVEAAAAAERQCSWE